MARQSALIMAGIRNPGPRRPISGEGRPTGRPGGALAAPVDPSIAGPPRNATQAVYGPRPQNASQPPQRAAPGGVFLRPGANGKETARC